MSDFYGTDTNDTIYGTINNDSLYGGLGDDILSSNIGNDSIYGDMSSNLTTIDSELSMATHPGNDFLIGGSGNDGLLDEFGVNRLYGGSGDDSVIGSGTLYGGDGNDYLRNSFQGHSIETGGRGADLFSVFLNPIPDQFIPGTVQPTIVIKDFHPREGDKISLTAQDNLGNWFGTAYNHSNYKDVFTLFDSNHDNKLSTTDDHVVHVTNGIQLQWWDSNLTVEHVNSISPDWIV